MARVPFNYAGSIVLLLIFNVLVLGGCDHAPMHAIDNQSTPKELLKKFHFAIRDHDKARFLECYAEPEKYKEVLVSIFDAHSSAWELREKLLKTRGPDAWEKLRETKWDPISYHPFLPPVDIDWWNKTKTNVIGNTATFTFPWDDPAVYIEATCYSGVWKFSSHINDPAAAQQLEECRVFGRKLSDAYKKCIIELDNPNVSLKQIKEIIGKAFLEAGRTVKIVHLN